MPELGSGVDLLKQAANVGFYGANLDLAWAYAAGDGVPQDARESERWLDRLGITMGPWIAAAA